MISAPNRKWYVCRRCGNIFRQGERRIYTYYDDAGHKQRGECCPCCLTDIRKGVKPDDSLNGSNAKIYYNIVERVNKFWYNDRSEIIADYTEHNIPEQLWIFGNY